MPLWVARNQKGMLMLYKYNKPHRAEHYGHTGCDYWENGHDGFILDPSLFSDLKWEDEPLLVTLTEVLQ
jgi:hypothetical protein